MNSLRVTLRAPLRALRALRAPLCVLRVPRALRALRVLRVDLSPSLSFYWVLSLLPPLITMDWHTLPDHILQLVATHLPRPSLLSFSNTCKRWHPMLEYNDAWKNIVTREYSRFMEFTENPADTNYKHIFRGM